MNKESVWAVILSAGSGTRISSVTNGVAKQFLHYNGTPLYTSSIKTFVALPYIDGIVIVLPEYALHDETLFLQSFMAQYTVPYILTAGSVSRASSMMQGVTQLPKACTTVYIHDASRPFFSATLAHRLYSHLTEEASIHGVIPSLPLTDTIKAIANHVVLSTPQREGYVAVQTPQIFKRTALDTAIASRNEHIEYTDDSSLLESSGFTVHTIEGEQSNIKITYPQDMLTLEQPTERIYKTVMGYDVHAYTQKESGRNFVIGGIHIQSPIKILAHSDGDVLLHALIDALLALTDKGDIGACFPDADAQYEGISSTILLSKVLDTVMQHAVRITHVDATIVAQEPRLLQYLPAIRTNLAYVLSLPLNAISIKATTEEKLGFTGKKEGIKAYCILSVLYDN